MYNIYIYVILYIYTHSSGIFPCFFHVFSALRPRPRPMASPRVPKPLLGSMPWGKVCRCRTGIPMPHSESCGGPCTASIGCGNWSHWHLAEFVTPWGLLWSKGWWTTTHVSSSRASFQLLPIHPLLLWNLAASKRSKKFHVALRSAEPSEGSFKGHAVMNHDEASLPLSVDWQRR